MVQIWYLSSIYSPNNLKLEVESQRYSQIFVGRDFGQFEKTFTSSHSRDLSMRITGNVLGLQGQPKVASPQTSVYPPSVWLKCYLLECMACQVDRWFTKGEENRLLRPRLGGPVTLKTLVIFCLKALVCYRSSAIQDVQDMSTQLASCNSHRTSWLASRLDFLQNAGCIHVYSDAVMCILIQYVRKYSPEKWRNDS